MGSSTFAFYRFFKLCPLLLMLALSGCVTAKIAINTIPEDAKVYVDGEYLGVGTVSVDTGQAEYGYPKELAVSVRHVDYPPFNTVIRNKMDWTHGAIYTGISAAIGLVELLFWIADPTEQYYLYSGTMALVLSPIAFFSSFKFPKSYEYDLSQ
jgi:hypothetical protein